MYRDADPATIPPAIGAWMISRMIILELKNVETQIEATIEAAIPIRSDDGPVYR